MVRERDASYAGVAAYTYRVLDRAVSPADFGDILLRRVLCVVNDKIGLGNEIRVVPVNPRDRALPRGQRGGVRFVIAAVRHACAIRLESISQGQCRMVQKARRDLDITNIERALDEVVVMNFRCEMLQRDRKVSVLHLTGERCPHAVRKAFRAVHMPGISRNEKRREKRDPLDMIPVGMADQQMAVDATFALPHQLLAEVMATGPAIDHEQLARIRAQLGARGIAAVSGGTWPRFGDRTACAPELYLHDLAPAMLWNTARA